MENYIKKTVYTLEPDLPRLGVPSRESFQPLAAILENKIINVNSLYLAELIEICFNYRLMSKFLASSHCENTLNKMLTLLKHLKGL